jgi:hypothetical protein
MRRAPALGEILVADEMAVALDVAVLAADDEEHKVVVTYIRDCAMGRRRDVHDAALAHFVPIAVDVEDRLSAVDEVQLVLCVVVVVRPLVVGREHEEVDAECRHTELLAHLAEAVPVPEPSE